MTSSERQDQTLPSDFQLEDGGFREFYDSQLDHLVPAEDRVEPRREDEEPEEVDDGLTDREKSAALDSFRENCRAVELASQKERAWSVEGLTEVEKRLLAVIKNQTPQPAHFSVRERVIKRIDSIVRQGLLQFGGMHVEHYGSFTSRLFTPTGDLDIAIEGTLERHSNDMRRGKQELESREGLNVAELNKDEKAMLLRALCNKLRNKHVCDGKIERILHARVPIIKFTDWESGIDCDMAVGSGGARFKSTVLRHLSLIDDRFPQLVRILKLWAQAFHMNDASCGTFNTFALTLMIVFHLQTRSPPILPPICELFDMPAGTIEGRPLHRGQRANMALLEGSEARAKAWSKPGNTENLTELMSSFFALYTTAVGVWTDNRSQRAIRCCTWAGKWAYKTWGLNYLVPIEDPFDSTDNCARSIFAANVGYVKDCFFQGLLALRDLRSIPAGESALKALFTVRETPIMRHPFRNGNRWQDGWGRRGNGKNGMAASGDESRDGRSSGGQSEKREGRRRSGGGNPERRSRPVRGGASTNDQQSTQAPMDALNQSSRQAGFESSGILPPPGYNLQSPQLMAQMELSRLWSQPSGYPLQPNHLQAHLNFSQLWQPPPGFSADMLPQHTELSRQDPRGSSQRAGLRQPSGGMPAMQSAGRQPGDRADEFHSRQQPPPPGFGFLGAPRQQISNSGPPSQAGPEDLLKRLFLQPDGVQPGAPHSRYQSRESHPNAPGRLQEVELDGHRSVPTRYASAQQQAHEQRKHPYVPRNR